MPTYSWLARFGSDFDSLSERQQAAFIAAIDAFVADLSARRGFRPGLRVKGVRGAAGIFEMTWAPDGRATFEYGVATIEGEPHIIWRRVGTHAIFDQP